MIYFLSTRSNEHPIRRYLRGEGASLASLIVPLRYEDLAAPADLPAGTYVFADIELLSDRERALAADARRRLADRGCRTLNDPERSLGRHDLLRMLHRRGINRFDVHRATSGESPRFPVFLRYEHDHKGRRSPLLHTEAALRAELDGQRARGLPLDGTLVVEFCDTAGAAGLYRKYGAFIVGDRVLARHLFFSRDWQVKDWDLMDDERLREELDYLAANPHAARLRELFAAAGIDYGRIDYSFLGDDIQVWEINTNPTIIAPGTGGPRRGRGRLGAYLARARRHLRPLLATFSRARARPRAPVHARFAVSLEAAWRALDAGP